MIKHYKINKEDESYIETLLINGKMINVFLSDSGQCYFLQYLDGEELKETGCGTYESDYLAYAEMLFEDPKNCEYYEKTLTPNICSKVDKVYCGSCKFNPLVIEREERIQKEYGMSWEEFKKERIKND